VREEGACTGEGLSVIIAYWCKQEEENYPKNHTVSNNSRTIFLLKYSTFVEP
jgi:hypothetical protein